MTKFIEYTDRQGCRSLVSINLVDTVADNNKTIILSVNKESITLAIAYETFTAWIKDGDKSPILSAGTAL